MEDIAYLPLQANASPEQVLKRVLTVAGDIEKIIVVCQISDGHDTLYVLTNQMSGLEKVGLLQVATTQIIAKEI